MLSSISESTQPIFEQQSDDEDLYEYGSASEYCLQVLEDAALMLEGKVSNWNEEAGCLSFGGFDHYLLPPGPDIPEEDLASACYMMRLPIAVGDEPWAAYMLELNLMLVASTGFALATDDERGLVLARSLTSSHMNAMTLASVVEEACDVIDSVIRDYLFEVLEDS